MFKEIIKTSLLAVVVGLAGPAWSYDMALANSYGDLFAPAKGAGIGKVLHLMKPDVFVDKIKAKETIVAVDVRTPAETGVFSTTLPGSLIIPLNQLFSKDNLNRIPTDKTVVVICKSGVRATAAGTALRHIGFKNVYILKGGFQALSGYMGPKEANAPLKPIKK